MKKNFKVKVCKSREWDTIIPDMYEIIFQSLGFILILRYNDRLSYGFTYITILWHKLMDFKPG